MKTETITIATYSFPVEGTPLHEAIFNCWRTSNFPFTDKVFLRREDVNEMLNALFAMNRRIEALEAGLEKPKGEQNELTQSRFCYRYYFGCVGALFYLCGDYLLLHY